MRLRVPFLAAIASLVFAQAALAVGRDRLSYTGVEASYGRVTADDSDASADRLDLRASLDLGGPVPVFVSASRSQVESEEVQFSSLRYSTRSTISRVDLGLHFGSDSTANFVPSLSLVEARGEFLGDLAYLGDHSDTGWAARAAVRALARSWVELGAFIEMMKISEETTATAGAEAILYPLRHVGVGVGYETSEGTQSVVARVRIVQ